MVQPETAGNGQAIDEDVERALFSDHAAERLAARRLIRQRAAQVGVWCASLAPIYQVRATTATDLWTVPAVNIRGMSYEFCRALFRAIIRERVGLFIFEAARSELEYGEQTPDDLAVAVLAAAVREGYRGPVFLQGDHYKVRPAVALAGEEEALGSLIEDSLQAGYGNIDIDASGLVDVNAPTVDQQQSANVDVTARLVRFIRHHGGDIAIGGEIGEIGKKNSTVDELRAFMNGLRDQTSGLVGLSKIAVQTGTSHGGVVDAQGKLRPVVVDFEALTRLSRVARTEYGLAGVVQHGASTLSDEQLAALPNTGCVEVHLSTQFQNIIFDHPAFPPELRAAMQREVQRRFTANRVAGQTDAQLMYQQRKRLWGPFRHQLVHLPVGSQRAIAAAIEEKVTALFRLLRVRQTASFVSQHVSTPT